MKNLIIKPQELEFSDEDIKVIISIKEDGSFSITPEDESNFRFVGDDPQKLGQWKRIAALIDRAIDFIESQYDQKS